MQSIWACTLLSAAAGLTTSAPCSAHTSAAAVHRGLRAHPRPNLRRGRRHVPQQLRHRLPRHRHCLHRPLPEHPRRPRRRPAHQPGYPGSAWQQGCARRPGRLGGLAWHFTSRPPLAKPLIAESERIAQPWFGASGRCAASGRWWRSRRNATCAARTGNLQSALV